MLTIVNDRGNYRRVGETGGESVAQMRRFAGAARRDYRNRNRGADSARDLEIVAELGAVAIDRVDAKLTRAEPLALERPCERVAPGRLASAVDHDFVTGRQLGPNAGLLHLHREDDALAAECARALRDKFR